MDVFSLLKFWRNAGVGDPINPADFGNFTDDEEGSFFELVFTNPNTSPSVNVFHRCNSNLDGVDKIDSVSTPSNHTTLFFNNKRKILPIDSTTNTKPPRSPFRVLMLGFQSTKSKDKKEPRCEMDEVVTISSLLNRDNSLRSKLAGSEKVLETDHEPGATGPTSKRLISKDAVHRYLNLIKPWYVKVSRRTNWLTERSSFYVSPEMSPKTSGRRVFREVRKHLGKSRSSSSAVKPIPSPAARRDDSALQQQDGIQSAILHCKKSYNSPGCYGLSRSGSAPLEGPGRFSIDEEKRSSI